jgi:ABC-2 type transport system permease protein
MLTHNWLSFADVMRTHIIWSGIVRNLGLQAAYVLIFGSAAWARFTPRDILA